MSNLLQPAHHPDADQLSAFAEHALPLHEQQQTLAHLATCPDCRALVFLAQQAIPAEAPQPLPARRPWFSTWNLAWAATAAFACALLVTIGLHNFSAQNPPPAANTVAQSTPPPAPPAPPILASPPAAKPAPPLAIAPNKLQSLASAPRTPASISRTPVAPQPAVALSPPTPMALHGAFSARTAIAPRSSMASDGSIRGIVADRSGAAVANALVTATNTGTGVQTARTTSSDGGYVFRQLPPGHYNIETVARGFERLLQEDVQVAPQQIAGLNMKLNVGSASETVTVSTAPAPLNTQDASLGGTIENELYSQLPLSIGGNPRDPTAFASLTPGAAAAAPKAKAGASAGAGAYGGSGAANMNENYIEGVPVANASAQGNRSAIRGAVSADSVDQFSVNRASTATQTAPIAGQPQQRQTVTIAQAQTSGPSQTKTSQQNQMAAAPPPPPAAAAPATGTARPSTSVALGNASVTPVGNAGATPVAVTQSPPASIVAIKSLLALPSHLLAVSSVTRAAQTLAIDTAGTLYLSKDSGKTWQAVPTQWTGQAIKLNVAAPLAGLMSAKQKAAVEDKANRISPSPFELTTASGTVWTSSDGEHWKPK
jgi:hypothetical protein